MAKTLIKARIINANQINNYLWDQTVKKTTKIKLLF